MNERYFQFADSLAKIGAIKFSEFTLRSGAKSPIYIDLRLLRSYPLLLRRGANILYELSMQGPPFDVIADVPTAATPLVSAISVLHDLPMVTPREPKGHGTKATVEGAYHEDMKVRLFDDLITTAGSKLTAIEILKTVGLEVQEVCVIMDREQGGQAGLAAQGYTLRAAFTLRDLIERFYRGESATITTVQYNEVISYLEQTKK